MHFAPFGMAGRDGRPMLGEGACLTLCPVGTGRGTTLPHSHSFLHLPPAGHILVTEWWRGLGLLRDPGGLGSCRQGCYDGLREESGIRALTSGSAVFLLSTLQCMASRAGKAGKAVGRTCRGLPLEGLGWM